MDGIDPWASRSTTRWALVYLRFLVFSMSDKKKKAGDKKKAPKDGGDSAPAKAAEAPVAVLANALGSPDFEAGVIFNRYLYVFQNLM